MTDDARAYLRDFGVDEALLDATSPDEWYLLLQEHRLFGGVPTMTAADVAARAGIDADDVRRLWRLLGFDDPGDDVVFHDADLTVYEMYVAGSAVFGREPVEHFTRALAASARRLTDATSALFLEVLGPERATLSLRDQLEQASLGGDLMARMPDEILRPLVYRFAIESQVFGRAAGAVNAPEMDVAIGFCDLVGSTELLNRLPAAMSGRALLEFEAAVGDAAQRHRGRVVKLIGDEALFIGVDVAAVEAIARELLAWVGAHDVLTGARAGVAVGRVLIRGGDVYGPPVNLAARLVPLAAPGEIVLADDDGDEVVEVRGFDAPVRVSRR